MTYNIIVENEARYDLINIYNFITQNDSSVKAKKFIFELKKSMLSLETMPHRCRDSHYIEDKDTRDLIYKKYPVDYRYTIV